MFKYILILVLSLVSIAYAFECTNRLSASNGRDFPGCLKRVLTVNGVFYVTDQFKSCAPLLANKTSYNGCLCDLTGQVYKCYMANCPNDSAMTGLLLTSSRYCASATAFLPQATIVPSIINASLSLTASAPLATRTVFSGNEEEETGSDSSYVMPSTLPNPNDHAASSGLSIQWLGLGVFACILGIMNL